MKQVIIRKATRKDGPAILDLIDALADFEKLKRPTRAARKRLLRDAFGKRFDVFLAIVEDKVVGYAIIFETYSSFLALPSLYLEDIFILPEYRKHKIGLRLFRTCLKEARVRGCGRIEWVVLDWNKTAIKFYETLGAQRMKEWLLYRMELG